MIPDPTPPSGESAPPSLGEGGTGADHSAVLPDARWRALNDRWHSGAKLTDEEFGALLDLALEYHLDARRFLQERDTLARVAGLAEARAARLEEAHAVLAAFARTAPGCLPERVQRAVDLAPWDGALYRALLNPEGGDHADD